MSVYFVGAFVTLIFYCLWAAFYLHTHRKVRHDSLDIDQIGILGIAAVLG